MANKTILIAGGTGLVGTRLQQIAEAKGYDCFILTRSPREKNHIHWDVDKKYIDKSAMPEIDYLVNLTGEGIADKKWTPERKKALIDSRTEPIQLLSSFLSAQENKIKGFVSASGVGYYGESGDNWQKETDPSGDDFLAHTAKVWEKAVIPISNQGIRTVILRFGIVLSLDGGALPKMAMTFKAGFGSYFGNGKQYMPWIHIDDLCQMILFSLENESVEGIYNGVAPNPVTNYDMTKAIAKALGMPPILLPAPKLAVQLLMGERYQLVFKGNRASADKILQEGMLFNYNQIEKALQNLYNS